MTHGDPENPKKNPHPVQRYEVTATTDAPGPWDSVSGYIGFDVVTPECTPENKFLGVHILPKDVGVDIEMTRIAENTWSGYFFRDFIQDEDYYGLGGCHWDATSVTADFTARKVRFNSGSVLDDVLQKGPQSAYFRKSDFRKSEGLDSALVRYGAPNFSAARPEYIKEPADFFPITLMVTKVTP